MLQAQSLFELTASHRCKSEFSSLEFVTGHERVNHDGRTDQWQRDKGETDFRAGKILCSDCTDLCADDCAGMHDQRDQNVDVAFDRMSNRSVTRGNDDFKKIRSDGEVRGDSEDVNHRGHPDVTSAAAKKTAEDASNKGDEKDGPE